MCTVMSTTVGGVTIRHSCLHSCSYSHSNHHRVGYGWGCDLSILQHLVADVYVAVPAGSAMSTAPTTPTASR